jgi:putative ABC transport system substrate-binding protein
VLFGIPDKLVLSRNTAKPILLASYRNRIPLVGLSFKWVKAGALYALERDYEDIGTQCGEMAQKILQGAAVTTLPPEPPRKVIYALNRKTIENMNINMPNTLLSNAVKIFE